MQDLARHYGTAVLPARPYKPRDKAKVEQAVLLAQRWIIARLRNQRFFCLVELNGAITELVRELNERLMRAYGMSRAELFAEVDAPALKPLPAEPYAFAEWTICRLAPDYHVEVDGNWYSVPYRLIREQVDVRASERAVEIFHKGERVASHARVPGRRSHHDPRRAHAELASTPCRMDADAPAGVGAEDRSGDGRAGRRDHDRAAASRAGLPELSGHPRSAENLRPRPAGGGLPARGPDQGPLRRALSAPSSRPGSTAPSSSPSRIPNLCATATSAGGATSTDKETKCSPTPPTSA